MFGSIFSGYFLSDVFSANNTMFDLLNDNHFDFHRVDLTEFVKKVWVEPSIVIAGGETYINSLNSTFFETEFLPWHIKLAPLFCNLIVIFSTMLFVYLYNIGVIPQYIEIVLAQINTTFSRAFRIKYRLARFYLFLNRDFNRRAGYWLKIAQNNFYFNEVYNYVALVNFHYYYQGIFLNLDKGLFELAGPTGLSRLYIYITKKFVYFYEQGLTRQLFLIYNTILIYFFIIEYFI